MKYNSIMNKRSISKSKNSSQSSVKSTPVVREPKEVELSEDIIDPSLLDIISTMIDGDSVQNINESTDTHEENMVPAIDISLPDGVKRIVRAPCTRISKKNTRSVEENNELSLIAYVNTKDPHDSMYNFVNSFERRHIQELLDEIKKSETGFLHPTVFVRLSIKINNSSYVHRIQGVRPISKKIFFNPRKLNDLRVKAKDIKEYIAEGTHSAEEIEFRVYGLLAHLNNMLGSL